MVFVGGNLTSITFPGVSVRGTGINWHTHLKQQLNMSTAHAAHKRPPASHPKDPLSLAKVIDVQAPIGPTAEEEVGRGCVTSRREKGYMNESKSRNSRGHQFHAIVRVCQSKHSKRLLL